MTRVPTVRTADVARVLKAMKAEGRGVARIFIRPSEVEIIPGALTDDGAAPQLSDLDAWRNRKRGAGAA